jgi:hypothetical protein
MVNQYWEKCKAKNSAWIIAGFCPTLLYRAAEPEKFKKMVLDNRIASAKIIGIDYEISLMWQNQVDALRAGASADLVAAMNR